jgi:hypothetical protein
MEIILREHIDNLGRRGEIVKVADGYARNYLLPRKLALLANAGNKQQIERERAKFDAKEAEEQKVAEGVAARLANVEVVIARRRHRRRARRQGRRARSPQDSAGRRDQAHRGVRRSGKTAPGRDDDAEGEGRRGERAEVKKNKEDVRRQTVGGTRSFCRLPFSFCRRITFSRHA